MTHHFTVPEANETLDLVKPMIEEMMRIGDTIRLHQPELWSLVEKSAGDGGNPELSRLLKDFDRLDVLLHRVQDLGILVKDLKTGLIDFPALRGDHEVYLCWKYGEESIQFWHEIDAGFAGRQSLGVF